MQATQSHLEIGVLVRGYGNVLLAGSGFTLTPLFESRHIQGWLWILHDWVDKGVWISSFLALWYYSHHRSCYVANSMLKPCNRARLSTSYASRKSACCWEHVKAGSLGIAGFSTYSFSYSNSLAISGTTAAVWLESPRDINSREHSTAASRILMLPDAFICDLLCLANRSEIGITTAGHKQFSQLSA